MFSDNKNKLSKKDKNLIIGADFGAMGLAGAGLEEIAYAKNRGNKLISDLNVANDELDALKYGNKNSTKEVSTIKEKEQLIKKLNEKIKKEEEKIAKGSKKVYAAGAITIPLVVGGMAYNYNRLYK